MHIANNLDMTKVKIISEECPFQEAMNLIAGKWTMSIINTLMNGTLRFKELERCVSGINTRMLVKELKHLESGKIIKREAFATVPPTVQYSLTEKGVALKPVLIEIQTWAMKDFI